VPPYDEGVSSSAVPGVAVAVDVVLDDGLYCGALGKDVTKGGFGGGPGGAWLGATDCDTLRGRGVTSWAGGVRALLELFKNVEV
jgi:hypothetical protein